MDILEKAKYLSKSSNYEDIDKIQDCIVSLLEIWSEAYQKWSENKRLYELERCRLYIDMKKKKKKWDSKMTDTDIDKHSKYKALENNEHEKELAYARVLKEYLDILKDLKIQLMSDRKHANG